MKKSARVSEKLVSPGLSGLQVALTVRTTISAKSLWTPLAEALPPHPTFHSVYSSNCYGIAQECLGWRGSDSLPPLVKVELRSTVTASLPNFDSLLT